MNMDVAAAPSSAPATNAISATSYSGTSSFSESEGTAEAKDTWMTVFMAWKPMDPLLLGHVDRDQAVVVRTRLALAGLSREKVG